MSDFGPFFDAGCRSAPFEQITVDTQTAARMLMLDPETIRKLHKRGELPAFNMAGPRSKKLFRVKSLRAWAKRREQQESANGTPAADQPPETNEKHDSED
jgi:hypothetical protein